MYKQLVKDKEFKQSQNDVAKKVDIKIRQRTVPNNSNPCGQPYTPCQAARYQIQKKAWELTMEASTKEYRRQGYHRWERSPTKQLQKLRVRKHGLKSSA